MIVSIHQPAYLPWLGYFDRIFRSDLFVFLDTVQFEKNSFINRNRIKTNQGPLWLTIPVLAKGHMKKTLLDIEIDQSKSWEKKHLSSIVFNYKRAPFFEQNILKLGEIFEKISKEKLLSELCFKQLCFWVKELGIETKLVRASDYEFSGSKCDLVFNICRHFNASKYVSGSQGKGYLKVDRFQQAGIEVEFQDYREPVYEQLHGAFHPMMSVLDFWMNSRNFEKIWGL